jgi:hypothetical protein
MALVANDRCILELAGYFQFLMLRDYPRVFMARDQQYWQRTRMALQLDHAP